MKKSILILCVLACNFQIYALSGKAYLERFAAYNHWSENLPDSPNPDFLVFIDSNTPLAKKLRNKWLFRLASQKDWSNFSKYYQPTNDTSLQCDALLAHYYQGYEQAIFQEARRLWLSADFQPAACNDLFKIFMQNPRFDESLLRQRIILALDKKNLDLARYLLKQYKNPRLKDEQLLNLIFQNPKKIMQLQSGDLYDYFYLFGLKRLATMDMDLALRYWQDPKTKKMLSEAQQQNFLAHLALYKAMRNHEDTAYWVSKIKPMYYTAALLDWQIRLALGREDWPEVERLIRNYRDNKEPCWRYWFARALEAQGNPTEAKIIYSNLAQQRSYYGFLSSLRLQRPFTFVNELPVADMRILQPYQPFIETIRFLYSSKQLLQAARQLNDFMLELPKQEKSALLYWLSKELKWQSQTIYLSNNEELNNQLALRFPLAFPLTIREYTAQFGIPAELVYAIIRQESGFREDVTSSAGARGLMQIMPATAHLVARRERISYTHADQLFTSHKNILIGTAYLRSLIKQYKHLLLVAAAYNAGPKQVNYWLKIHPTKQIDVWIETLPWQETRNYLKNIMCFYLVYQYQIGVAPNLKEFTKPFR